MKNLIASLLHTAWTEEEKMQLDQTIEFVEEYKGHDFLTAACQYLYSILTVDYIHIGLFKGNTLHNKINTVARILRGQVLPNNTYNLNKSPFKHIFKEELIYLPFGLSAMYPEAELIKDKNYESYLGMPILAADEEPLGIIALLHSRIIERGGFVEALLNAIAPRIEIELALKQIQLSCDLEAYL